MLKNVKFFVIIQEWLKGCTFRTTQDLIILSSLTNLWNCYYDLFTENMSTEYSQKSKLKENDFITGLGNKLRTIRRKDRTYNGRTKIIVWTMCCQFTSYQFEETLRAFIKNKSGLRRSRKRRSQRLDSRSQPENSFQETGLSKWFKSSLFWKTNWSGKLLSQQVERTLPDGSLDMRHLIIILTKMRCCKWCYCDFCHLCIC